MTFDEYRNSEGITYAELARRIGVDRDSLYRWRTGERRISRFGALHVEEVTKGKITAKELRPDRY